VTDLHDQGEDGTPISAEERDGLIPSHIAYRRELNALEQENILRAALWANERRRDPVSETFAKGLHRRMYDEVWTWAGEYRTSDKNIGCSHWQVQTELNRVLNDVRYWINNKTFSPDEIAVRFAHGIVLVHPFPNGNGRWSRLMADILIVRLGGASFTWGRGDLRDPGTVRQAYIAALKLADNHDFAPLLAFARS
jgi:Fic-DOC domain mobile mystery protein B